MAKPLSAPTLNIPRSWLVLVGLVAAIWLVGAGIYGIATYRHRQEVHARYEPVDVSQPALTRGRPDFVALRGRVHPAGYLTLRQGSQSEKTFFLPLVGGSPYLNASVHWIVQLEGASLPDFESPLLAHDQGHELAQAARQAFEGMGVHIGADAVVVEHVPSRNGVVLDRDEDDRTFFLGVASFVTLIVVMLFTIFALLGLRLRRLESRRRIEQGTAPRP
jgi:hypothetical protein